MKKISIVVPCYNSAEYLPTCLGTLSAQTMPLSDIEIILVNDASTDDGRTLSMLEAFRGQYPESVKVITHSENRRQGGSRNSGVAAATGEYLAFVDPDDFISRDFCALLYEKAVAENADVVQFGHCDYILRDGAAVITNELHWKDEAVSISSHEERVDFVINGTMTLGNWNKLYRRQMLVDAEARFGENTNYEEPLFTYPLKYYVNKYVSISECLYYWQNRESSILHTDMLSIDCISQHMDQAKALLLFMRQKDFYEEYQNEAELRFVHAYILETLAFCGKKSYIPSAVMFRRMCEEYKELMTEDTARNPYLAPPSFYSTLIRLTASGEVSQEILGEIVTTLAEL